MVEQLDIFKESEEKKSDLTPRQWALYRLIKHNSLVEHRKTTQKEICDTLFEYGYKYNDSITAHDRCTMIWKDIVKNNLSIEHDKIIISDNFEYWIGNEEETQEYLDQLWKDLCPRLVRYWNYRQKVARNGQGQLLTTQLNPIDEDSKARAFIESYGAERISNNEHE